MFPKLFWLFQCYTAMFKGQELMFMVPEYYIHTYIHILFGVLYMVH